MSSAITDPPNAFFTESVPTAAPMEGVSEVSPARPRRSRIKKTGACRRPRLKVTPQARTPVDSPRVLVPRSFIVNSSGTSNARFTAGEVCMRRRHLVVAPVRRLRRFGSLRCDGSADDPLRCDGDALDSYLSAYSVLCSSTRRAECSCARESGVDCARRQRWGQSRQVTRRIDG